MFSKTNAPRASVVVEVRGMPSRCRVMDAPGTTAPLGSNTVPAIGGDGGSPQTLAAKTASSTIAETAPFTMPPRVYRDADTTAALPSGPAGRKQRANESLTPRAGGDTPRLGRGRGSAWA